ncbi:MAG TPA: RodZ domain-containing protein, partial [Sphingomicrobium sp.]|nr:RodZ domain-containing protein [Sphingomicrobium sp.]
MAKRDPDPEPPEEEVLEPELPPVGERLRIAREAKGLSLEDVAAQTRIPQRHLASIETADWDNLPAPTYTIGFAKSYASAVDLDRTEVGIQLREEMGGQRFASTSSDVFEPADPARTMPKGLVIGAIAGVIVLIALMSWLNSRSLQQSDEPIANVAAPEVGTPATPLAATASAPATSQGPVVLTATAPVWLQVSEQGGATLFSGLLQTGQAYTVPATATAPVLKTGKPEALRITVGTTTAAPVGPAATTVSDVSLLPASLLKAPAAQGSAAPPP